MIVWLVTVGEPLPSDNDNVRLLRTGALANALVESGNKVVWWSSTFDHSNKCQRFENDTTVDLGENYRLILLKGRSYSSNVSVNRVLNHREIAEKFASMAEGFSRPDVIVCSLPTLELSCEAGLYGRTHGVPVVLDIRDLWPDVFLDLLPDSLKGIGRICLLPMERQAARACRRATAIIGNSPAFVEWGVRHAGRAQGAQDQVFPFGYSSEPPPPDMQDTAFSFWKGCGIQRGDKVFTACFFGTLGRQFDLETVIEAAKKLAGGHRRFRFVICGTGDRLEEYKRISGDCGNILFPGWVGRAEIWTLMQLSQVGLAPYITKKGFSGNLPNKPLEYMSAGLPIVSSLRGYLADLLAERRCGLTYENGDIGELASVFKHLYDTPSDLDEMSQNASVLFHERYTAEQIYPRIVDYLGGVANS
jgi:glycosyltransferase involved in cell wall biosynthesis